MPSVTLVRPPLPTGPAVPNRWIRLLPLVGLLVLLAVGCRREPEAIEGAPPEPVEAVAALADALRDGDLERFARLSVPPAMYAEQQALWRRELSTAAPLDPAEAERWRDAMALLTAPEAEAVLWAKAEPRLKDLEQQIGPKWDIGVTMMAGFATAAVEANATLSEPEKAHARGLIDAVQTWAGDRARFTDPARAKQAIGVAVRTARVLDLPDLDVLRGLELEAALAKGGVAFRGAKSLAAAYGVDVDAALSKMQAETIALEGDRATVRVRYPLLGRTVEFEQPMVRIDGGWYRADAVESHRAAMAEATASASADATAAPATTPPAP